ncbi:MAG: glutamate ABC transporter substrate-binding protein [Actinomycetota bacterium]|nr:glutamate ABC transporter substrate-binding protein [Actinomycetota bacterium]
MTGHIRRWLAVPLLLTVLAGCGYDATLVPPVPEKEVTVPEPPGPQDCMEPTRSYQPTGSLDDLASGATVEKIHRRGRLIAGVSADTYLLASRNPFNSKIEGFDIDMVKQVALAIFGPGGESKVQLRVITAADRIPVLKEDQVDIVVRNMTINCERWEEIAFSAVYYQSGQKVLVRSDLVDEGVVGVDDLAGVRVCAPDGTTSLANIVDRAPDAEIVIAATHTGCLVRFQRGEVDAITGDDTVLAGLAAQDPYAVVPAGQDAFTEEPYGIAVNKENRDLVRFINALLEQMRDNGSWQRSYDTWLASTLGTGISQPMPTYGRVGP